MELARDRAENHHTDWITTYRGDLSFPWPAGKAPWSIEQGGNGTAPRGARVIGQGLYRETKDQFEEGGDGDAPKEIPLQSLDSIGEINSETIVQCMEYLTAVAERMDDYIKERQGSGMAAKSVSAGTVTSLKRVTELLMMRKEWAEAMEDKELMEAANKVKQEKQGQ